MKLPDKYGERLLTQNFRKITSQAVISIDYHAELKIIEIEYTGGKLYHYPGIEEKVWFTFLQFVNVGRDWAAILTWTLKK